MPVAEATKKVLFVCPGGLNLTLTLESEEQNRETGVHVKGHRIYFKRASFGGAYRGEFLTSKQYEINFIRNHEWFRQGPPPKLEDEIVVKDGQVVMTKGVGFGTTRAIYEADYNPEEKREGPNIVHRRGDPIEPAEHEEIPQETAPKPLKARVAKGLKKSQ